MHSDVGRTNQWNLSCLFLEKHGKNFGRVEINGSMEIWRACKSLSCIVVLQLSSHILIPSENEQLLIVGTLGFLSFCAIYFVTFFFVCQKRYQSGMLTGA
jgi:hypothetical protein